MMTNLDYKELPTPPRITTETMDKLLRTAKLMAEICSIWQTEEWGTIPIRDDPIKTPVEGDSDYQSDCFVLDWYQRRPFVVGFHNPNYESVLRAQIIDDMKEESWK